MPSVREIITEQYRKLRALAENKHVGMCMSTYYEEHCYDCPTEANCLGLFVKNEMEKDAKISDS